MPTNSQLQYFKDLEAKISLQSPYYTSLQFSYPCFYPCLTKLGSSQKIFSLFDLQALKIQSTFDKCILDLIAFKNQHPTNNEYSEDFLKHLNLTTVVTPKHILACVDYLNNKLHINEDLKTCYTEDQIQDFKHIYEYEADILIKHPPVTLTTIIDFLIQNNIIYFYTRGLYNNKILNINNSINYGNGQCLLCLNLIDKIIDLSKITDNDQYKILLKKIEKIKKVIPHKEKFYFQLPMDLYSKIIYLSNQLNAFIDYYIVITNKHLNNKQTDNLLKQNIKHLFFQLNKHFKTLLSLQKNTQTNEQIKTNIKIIKEMIDFIKNNYNNPMIINKENYQQLLIHLNFHLYLQTIVLNTIDTIKSTLSTYPPY